MTDSAHSKFIRAGETLYPSLGYRKLSVRALAQEAGLSAGMFHHLFSDKDAFVLEMLELRNRQILGELEIGALPDNPFEKLRLILTKLAHSIRQDLQLVHRLFADSADGVEVINRFLRAQTEQRMDMMTDILEACSRCDNSRPATTVQRLSYVSGSVTAPMLLASRFQQMGLLPDRLAQEVPDIFSDAAIAQRIEWCIEAMFPAYRETGAIGA